MDEEWIDELKSRFEEETIPLPEDDWEELWARYVHRRKQRQARKAIYFVCAFVAAASVALFFINRTVPEAGNTDVPVSNILSVVQPENKDNPEIFFAAVTPVSPVTPFAPVTPQTTIASSDTCQETSDAETKKEEDIFTDKVQEKLPTEVPFVFTEIEELAEKKSHRLSVSPYLKGTGSVRTTESARRFPGQLRKIFPDVFPQSVVEEDMFAPIDGRLFALEGSHSIPLSFGLDARFAISGRVGVTSGLDLSRYRSRFLVNNDSLTQNAYYLGIPLRLDWTVWDNGPLGAWVGAGGKVDRLVYGKLGSERISDNTFHWSATAVAGIQYELWRNVGVFVEPELSYYFKPSDPVIQTYRTENPLMFTIGAGLRINLR